MTLYGPFTATAGQVTQCTVSTDPNRLRFVNTSRLDLAVAFTQAAPPAFSSGRAEYRYLVPSGDRMTVDIPFEVYGSFGFPGYVFVYGIDNTVHLAQGGTISANVTFSIETFIAGQTAPTDYASPQRLDASSQQRVIALNYGAISRAKQSLTINATGLQNTYTLAGVAGVPLNPNAPGSPGSFDWAGYLNYLDMYADVDSYELHWVLISNDTSGNPQFSDEIWRGRVTPSAPIERSFIVTPTIVEALVSNTATIQAQLFIDVLSAAGGKLVFTSGWTVDFLSGVVVPAIGQGSSVAFQSTGGAVF